VEVRGLAEEPVQSFFPGFFQQDANGLEEHARRLGTAFFGKAADKTGCAMNNLVYDSTLGRLTRSQVVFSQSVTKRQPGDAKQARGLQLVAVGHVDGLGDDFALAASSSRACGSVTSLRWAAASKAPAKSRSV
jgi:hypothetical protein